MAPAVLKLANHRSNDIASLVREGKRLAEFAATESLLPDSDELTSWLLRLGSLTRDPGFQIEAQRALAQPLSTVLRFKEGKPTIDVGGRIREVTSFLESLQREYRGAGELTENVQLAEWERALMQVAFDSFWARGGWPAFTDRQLRTIVDDPSQAAHALPRRFVQQQAIDRELALSLWGIRECKNSRDAFILAKEVFRFVHDKAGDAGSSTTFTTDQIGTGLNVDAARARISIALLSGLPGIHSMTPGERVTVGGEIRRFVDLMHALNEAYPDYTLDPPAPTVDVVSLIGGGVPSGDVVEPLPQHPQRTATANEVVPHWYGLKHLTKGGQGDLWLVERRNPYAIGVLKRIKRDLLDDEKAARRMLREIGRLKRLQHPCIVRVLAASTASANPWLVTAYAPHGSLHDNISVLAGDAWRVLRIARDVALGLQAAHDEQIVHRDLKPKNILLFSLDHAAVADFGISYDPDETELTTDSFPGTRWFSPPERYARRTDPDAKPSPLVDVYALGRTIYNVLSGGDRFEDADYGSTERLAQRLARPQLSIVDRLLARMAAEAPTQRLSSMRAVVGEIDDAVARLFGYREPPRADECLRCGGTYESFGKIDSRIQVDHGKRPFLFLPELHRCNRCGDVRMVHNVRPPDGA